MYSFAHCTKMPPRRFPKDLWLIYKLWLIYYAVYDVIISKILFRHIMPSVGTKPNFDSISTKMAMCRLKCEVLSFMLKRQHLDSLIEDFWLIYTLVKLRRILWCYTKISVCTNYSQHRHKHILTPDPLTW